MKRDRESPPRWAERLLAWFLPSGVKGRSILGDAREEYLEQLRSGSRVGAGLWYWKNVVSIMRHLAGRSKRSVHGSRHVGRGARMSNLLMDLRHAARSLVKKPGFALAAVLTLGLGIGANTTIFSLVYGVLLKPLPYPEPERLVGVFRIDPKVTGENPTPAGLASLYAVPYAVYLDWSEMSPVFESCGAYAGSAFTLTGGDRPERLKGAQVTSGVFEALGVKPLFGRTFLAEDDKIGAPHLLVLSYRLWQGRFGSDPGIVGQQQILNGLAYTIVGVMPPGFSFPEEDEALWTTLSDQEKSSPIRNGGWLQVIARLKPGVSPEQAHREMDGVAQRNGRTHPEEKEHGIGLFSLKQLVVADSRAGLLLLLGAVGLVLLIACANTANLLLVRASQRRRELGLRQALGAGYGRLIFQHLAESVLLSTLGGAAGYWFAVASLEPLTRAYPGGLPRAGEISVDFRLLFFAAGLSLLTGLVTGAVPAFRALRASVADILREAGRGFSGGRSRNRTQAALVVSEVAFAFVLLAGAGLFIQSFISLNAVHPGFVADNVLTMWIVLPSRYRDSEERAVAFFSELHETLGALPGVQAVAGANQMPFGEGYSAPPTSVETSEGIVHDVVHHAGVTPGYFSTMKIPLVAGRGLTQADRRGAQPIAVISEAMARKFWPGEKPIGRRIRVDVGDDPQWLTVVGMVGDVKYQLNWDPFPMFYVPYLQQPDWYQTIVLKTAMEPDSLSPSVRKALWAIDPDIPFRIESLQDRIDRSDKLAGQRFSIYILSCLSALAALLAFVGVYGVLAYTVAQRSNEIGIRMALGAGRNAVMRSVLARGLLMAGLGLGIGAVVAVAASQVIESLLFHVSPNDPATLAAVALLVTAAAMTASFVPAYRATKVDPAEALRQE